MKVLIVGAGGQGGPCASILSKMDEVTEIRLADLVEENAQKIAKKIGGNKIKTMYVNATKDEEVAKAAEGVDVVMDFSLPWMASHVMKGALKAKANYVNSAFDTPFWDELSAGKPLSLDKEFADAGLTALLGSGMAPGFVNVIIRLYADKLEEVESVKIRLGKKNTAAEKYDEYLNPWNPGWSPIQALKDCNDSAIVFEDKKHKFTPPYSGMEMWKFPEPVGEMLVSHHSHEEPYSVPSRIGKGLEYCDFKYYLHPQPASLIALGLASDKEIEVNGTKIKPIDFVTSILPKPGNAFLNEDPAKYAAADANNYVFMDVEVKGKSNGVAKTFLVHLPNMNVPGKAISDLFGTAYVNVALPAVTGARQIMAGGYKGVIFAEELDPIKYIDLLMSTGYPYKWEVEEK